MLKEDPVYPRHAMLRIWITNLFLYKNPSQFPSATYSGLESQLHSKPSTYALPKSIKQKRRRRQHKAYHGKHRDAPTVPQCLEERRRNQRHDPAKHGPEHGARRNRRRGIPLKRVNVVVLRAVDDHDLAQAVKKGAGDGDEPVLLRLYGPREPIERRQINQGLVYNKSCRKELVVP